MSHDLMVVSIYVMWVLLLVLLLAVFALYRHFGQLYVNSTEAKQNQGPRLGSAMVSMAGSDVSGRKFDLPATRPALVLLADTRCEICASIRDGLSLLEPMRHEAEVYVMCAGPLPDVTAWASRTPEFVRVVHDKKAAAANKLAVNGTPFAVVADAGGVVRWKGIVSNAQAVRAALSEVLLPELHPDGDTLPIVAATHSNGSREGEAR